MLIGYSLIGSLFLGSVCFAQDSDLRELRTDHFIVYYHPNVDFDYVNSIKNMCETYYRKITQEFKLVRDNPWLWERRAKIYVAQDKDDYLDRFECPPWSSACVNYHGKLIYTYPGQRKVSSMFAHELAHIIFREYAGFGTLPLWLDEAIAMYIEDKYNSGSYQNQLYILKRILKKDGQIPLSELAGISPWELNEKTEDYVSRFYLESFSIVHFLINKYGRDRFGHFLFFLKNGDNFQKALSKGFYQIKSMNELEKKWKKFYQK